MIKFDYERGEGSKKYQNFDCKYVNDPNLTHRKSDYKAFYKYPLGIATSILETDLRQ